MSLVKSIPVLFPSEVIELDSMRWFREGAMEG